MTITELAFPLAAVASATVVTVLLVRGSRKPREITLAVGMGAFALEALAAYALVGWTEEADDRALGLRVVMTAGVLVLLPWAAFIHGLLAPAGRAATRVARLALGLTVGVGAAVCVAIWLGEPFLVSDISGRFYAARLAPLGLYAVITQLLGTVAILAGLELCLRTANREARWRLKYLVLGAGGLFLVRFYLLSHVLLFHVLLAAYLTTQAAALVLASAAIGVSVLRAPLGGANLVISRSIALRSAAVGLLGLYLFVVGGLGWLLDRLGLSEELFWGALVVFAGAAVAGAFVLSEQLRWRMKRFVALNFYRSKYDYRAQWMAFTQRLGSTVTLEELAPQLLAATTDAIGTAKGVVYLGGDDGYQLGAAVEVYNPPAALPETSPLIRRARDSMAPTPVRDTERPAWFPQASILVPLAWQGSLTGIMILAPERAESPYSSEDVEFLTAVSVQVAGAIVTTRLSEAVARTREFEAFHRLMSFVAHDLKNAVTSLSMLGENARQHFDNPEFQRDALVTLTRTVDRMRKLLRRLTSAGEVPQVRAEQLDLGALLAERVVPLVRAPHVTLKVDLQPAPIVGDPDAIERVLQNLVINAIEAVNGGGDVMVRTTTRARMAVCEVSDTGCGMSPEFQRRSLFVPFRSGKKGGWGIGLYHAREVVRAHGGRIEVQSEEGQGTTFTVSFPAAGDRDAEAAP